MSVRFSDEFDYCLPVYVLASTKYGLVWVICAGWAAPGVQPQYAG